MLYSFNSSFLHVDLVLKCNCDVKAIIGVLKHNYFWIEHVKYSIMGENSGKPLSSFKVKEIKQFGI